MGDNQTSKGPANDNAVERPWKEQKRDPQLGRIIGTGLFARIVTKVETKEEPAQGNPLDGAHNIHVRLTTKWALPSAVRAWLSARGRGATYPRPSDNISQRPGAVEDGAAKPVQAAVNTEEKRLVIWFEDTSRAPSRSAPEKGSQGLSHAWLNALLGTATVLEVRYHDSDKSVIAGVVITVPRAASEQFSLAFYNSCSLLGTVAWIRDYDEPGDGYRKAWENF